MEMENVIDKNGNKIVNATQDNIDFSETIEFAFITGIIFPKSDQERLNKLLAVFQRVDDNSYLINQYRVYTYESEIARKIEEEFKIDHGNYRILLAVYNTKQQAFVSVETDWSAIESRFVNWVTNYGMYAPKDRSSDRLQNERGITNLTGDRYNFSLDFSLSRDVPKPEKTTKEFEGLGEDRDRVFVEKGDNQRAPGNISRDQRFEYGNSLMNRMSRPEEILEAQHDLPKVGQTLAMDEYFLPPEERKPQLKLFPGFPDAYDEETGTNRVMQMNPAYRQIIPAALAGRPEPTTNYQAYRGGPLLLPK